ncbi:MAG TPA: nucleoside transporter C-terminal domain-containing protein [Candidatus Dependentiae bacterium]|nr:nucleoside transporter C-terminal domain-containing protein [Candidatus Dependentiae bacterium]HRQ62388.1 nucleoside transporter C-terminal domain-containing protein [Candidatus Dependentiae bacterium]
MLLLDYLIEYNRWMNLIGIAVILSLLWGASAKRSEINYKLVFNGLLMQFLIGFFVLKTTIGQKIVGTIADLVSALYICAGQGSAFIFGSLVNPDSPWGFIFGFQVLPIIIFFGAFMAFLFHIGLVQKAVSVISYVIRPLLGTSGAETICAIANSFLGQTEAPLLIRHYLPTMTKSEILVVMISGMATISGAILVVFASMGVPTMHLLSASVMAIPTSIVVAKILYPETEKPKTMAGVSAEFEDTATNVLDAIAAGTLDGLQLALNVAAMLISFLALLALINYTLGFTTHGINTLFMYLGVAWQIPVITIELIFAYLFAPFGYLLGFTGHEALLAGELIGTKVAVNEVVAYSQMVTMPLSERTVDILTYALCGFSNFSCIGIQIGGIGALVPQKRSILTEFGFRTVFGAALANILSAMVAGLLL